MYALGGRRIILAGGEWRPSKGRWRSAEQRPTKKANMASANESVNIKGAIVIRH
jgi:hypothetical protein